MDVESQQKTVTVIGRYLAPETSGTFFHRTLISPLMSRDSPGAKIAATRPVSINTVGRLSVSWDALRLTCSKLLAERRVKPTDICLQKPFDAEALASGMDQALARAAR